MIQKLKRKPPHRLCNRMSKSRKCPIRKNGLGFKKIQFAIEHEDRHLTTKEIVDVLSQFEPSFLLKENVQ